MCPFCMLLMNTNNTCRNILSEEANDCTQCGMIIVINYTVYITMSMRVFVFAVGCLGKCFLNVFFSVSPGNKIMINVWVFL